MKKTCQEIYYYKFNYIFEGCVKMYMYLILIRLELDDWYQYFTSI